MTVNIYDMAQTWNDGAATFTGIKLNVTDTASASGSLLMDLQVGGTSRLSADKNGSIASAITSNSTPLLQAGISGGLYAGIYANQYAIDVALGATLRGAINIGSWGHLRYQINTRTLTLGFGSSSAASVTTDAANTLAQRNGANAQAFNIYNTYTDASNYERLAIRCNSNQFRIEAQAAGTGTLRSLYLGNTGSLTFMESTLQFTQGAGAPRLAYATSEVLSLFASGTGVALQLTEKTAPSAPAANQVRIYAEDDGAGKTRLMALFATGTAQQIAIEP